MSNLRDVWEQLCEYFFWLKFALWLLPVALFIVVAGQGRASREVLVTKGGLLPESLVETPDYYVVAILHSRELVRSSGYTDIPIGNGLRFEFPYALRPNRISHLCLMNEDLILDDVVEQVEMNGRKAKGQQYQFELVAPWSFTLVVGYILLLTCVGYLLYVVVWVVRWQAV